MSKKTKEILFWIVMFAAFITFICSFPSCSSTKQVEQAKYTTQTTLAEESVEVNGKEDVVIKSDENDTSVTITLTPMVDVPFSSTSEIYKGLNSEGYKVKEVKIKTKTTNQAITTTTNQTQKIQTKKSANLTGTEITTKQEKKNKQNILPFVMFTSLFCLFAFVLYNKK